MTTEQIAVSMVELARSNGLSHSEQVATGKILVHIHAAADVIFDDAGIPDDYRRWLVWKTIIALLAQASVQVEDKNDGERWDGMA